MLHLEMIAGFWFGIALRITIGIAVVSLLVTAFVRRFPKMPAEVRCGLWMVVILQGLLWFHVPVWIPPRPSASSAPAADRESSAPDQESTAASAGGQPGQVQTDGWAVLPAGAVPGEPRAPSTERASAHPAKSTEPLVARDGRWWPSLPISLKGALALVWITGVVGLTLLAVSRSWRFRRRVMARARAASAGLEEMARKLARRHGVLWRRGLRVL